MKNVPQDMHRAIKLSDGELIVDKRDEDGTWDLKFFQKLTKANNGQKKLKRKAPELYAEDEDINFKNTSKKMKSAIIPSQNLNIHSPLGLIWDEKDYSCAYDSLFTVFFHIWNEGQPKHKAYFENSTQMMRILHLKFSSLLNQNCTFESVRDHLREKLHDDKPLQYRYGTIYTDIDELVRDLTLTRSYMTSRLQCLNCKFSTSEPYLYLNDYTAIGWSSSEKKAFQSKASIQSYLNYKISKKKDETKKACPECCKSGKNFPLYITQCIDELPGILIFALASWIDINRSIQFNVSDSSKEYILKGVIYSNSNHFTARLVDENLNVWYHDGQTTRSLCQRECLLRQADDIVPLKTYGQYKAIMAFYVEN